MPQFPSLEACAQDIQDQVLPEQPAVFRAQIPPASCECHESRVEGIDRDLARRIRPRIPSRGLAEDGGGKTETILRRPRRGVYRATKAAIPATRWRLQRGSQASVVGSGLDAQSARYCRCRTFGCDRTSRILLGSCRGQSSLWRRQTPRCGHVAVGLQERWGKGKVRPSLH